MKVRCAFCGDEYEISRRVHENHSSNRYMDKDYKLYSDQVQGKNVRLLVYEVKEDDSDS